MGPEIDETLAELRTARQDTTAFGSPPPHRELKRLEPLLGAWNAADRTLDTFLGPAVPVWSAERFRWLDGGYFLVQHYETSFGDEPTSWTTTARSRSTATARSRFSWWLRGEDGVWQPWMKNTFTKVEDDREGSEAA